MPDQPQLILESAELRWFFEGTLPDSWLEWLSKMGGFPLAPEKRIDSYLKLNRNDLSIKIRSYKEKTNIEFKFLKSSTALEKPEGGIQENWTKWSLPLPVGFIANIENDERWIAIEKERYLIKISFDNDEPRFYTADSRPTNGCGIELTMLTMRSRKYWTFGYESFGSRLDKYLEQAIHLTVQTWPFFRGETGIKGSYPQWLHEFNRQP